MRLSQAIEELAISTKAAGRSERTIQNYRQHLAYLLDYLGDVDVTAVTAADLRRYAADLQERTQRYVDHPNVATQVGGLARDSVASYLRSVKRLFNWLAAEEILVANPAARLPLPRSSHREPKGNDPEEFLKLLAATAGDAPVRRRDRALLLFLADTGCRVGGLTRLRTSEVDIMHRTARLHEKGGRIRTVPFSPLTAEALDAWLAVRPVMDHDWLFVSMGSRASGGRLTEDAVGEVLRRLKGRARIKGRANPHSFRHGFAREWLRVGGDLGSLTRLLGHSDPSVTLRFYGRFGAEELHAFHRRYSPVSRLQQDENEEE